MHKLKMQIEGQLQEIVFFFSLLLSFSVFISGVFTLALTPDSVVFILGSFGAGANLAIFQLVGYGFFYVAVMALHMGYVTNMHIFKLDDFKREGRVLSYSLIAHLIILSLLASLLSVFQIYLQIPTGHILSHGAGGLLGNAFGQILYSGLGLYGSVIVLLLVAFVAAIMAGFFQLPDVLTLIKEAKSQTKNATVDGARTLNHSIANASQFLFRNYKLASAHAATSSKQWMVESYQNFSDKIHSYVTSIEGEPEKKKSAPRKAVSKKIEKEVKKSEEKIQVKAEKKAKSVKPVVAERENCK